MLKARFISRAALFARSLCVALTLAPAWAGAPASAAGLEELFQPLSQGGCAEMAEVRSAASVVQLTGDQFQFVRAFWMAIPPISKTLPPGDKAFSARDPDGATVFGLYDDGGKTCAVFKATDWMQKLVDQIGRGEVGKPGDGT